MKIDTKALLMILAGVVVLGGGYWYFFTGTGTQLPVTAETATTATPAQAQFETLVGELNPVSFDTSLFSDPRFAALVDLGTPVVPESSGRIDPFAPLGGK